MLVDRKGEFANEQVAKALLANALYEGRYPLVSALSRPVIAEAVAEIALELDAEAVVHGCTGKGNDQLRFELAFKAKYPGVHVIAPLRDKIWTRDEEIAYAERGIPVEAKAEKPYSIDDNLFGRAIEAGILEDAWVAPPEDAFLLTSHPSTARRRSTSSSASKKACRSRSTVRSSRSHELIATLNPLAGAYGIGRIDMIENRAIGIKSRELYEAPAAIALIEAHRALEDVVLTKAEAIAKRELEPKWAKLLYDGLWFSPLRAAYDAFFAATQTLVTGEVRLSLQPGAAVVTGRRSSTPSTPRRSRRTAPARRSRTRRPRGSSGSPRSRSSSPPRASGGSRTHDPLVRPRRQRACARGRGASCAPTTRSSSSTTSRRRGSTRSGSRAAGLLTGDELREAERLLDGLTWEPGDEDVHTPIERRLGEVGRKIHAGRSRNDQVAAAFRLYVADACAEAIETVERFAARSSTGPSRRRRHRCPATRTCSARSP